MNCAGSLSMLPFTRSKLSNQTLARKILELCSNMTLGMLRDFEFAVKLAERD